MPEEGFEMILDHISKACVCRMRGRRRTRTHPNRRLLKSQIVPEAHCAAGYDILDPFEDDHCGCKLCQKPQVFSSLVVDERVASDDQRHIGHCEWS